MYRFKEGEHVTHVELEDVKGTITKRVSLDEESGEQLDHEDPNIPWYTIEWDDGRDGFEHDLSLKSSI